MVATPAGDMQPLAHSDALIRPGSVPRDGNPGGAALDALHVDPVGARQHGRAAGDECVSASTPLEVVDQESHGSSLGMDQGGDVSRFQSSATGNAADLAPFKLPER